MDKRSILGLFIIGAILFAFSLFNANQDTSTPAGSTTASDSTKKDTTVIAAEETQPQIATGLVPKLDENGKPVTDSLHRQIYTDTITNRDTVLPASTTTISEAPAETTSSATAGTPSAKEKLVRIENDLLILDISSKGGQIRNVYLKKYRTYDAFINESNEPLQLIDSASIYGVEFFEGSTKRYSAHYNFRFVEQSDRSVTVEMLNNTGKVIGFRYTLEEGRYDVDFQIYFKGFEDADAQRIAFASEFKLLSTEKYLPTERQVAALFYKYTEDSYDYIQRKDYLPLIETTQWVAYKQSYFSSILISKTGFSPTKESRIVIRELPETDTTYVQYYKSILGLGITSMSNTVDLQWYFGPNDYDLLSTYENGTEDIVDLGWGLFRWINVYGMRPMFNLFLDWGMGVGLAILLLTIVVKMILSPVNYKMYKSSAMMKALKPEIDAISKKFPKREDATKKQQALFGLYREAGVNPFAGCIPMLIQMPILFAIFRLFPSSLELRQRPFLWAEDLSSYDSVLNLGFNIPFYGDHISLFTLLMAGTTLLYTHYNSSNMQQPAQEGMPNMKVIMYIFPILMIFFFNNFSSGLSYYYFISTLITIIIMWAIKRFLVDEQKLHAQIQDNKANPQKKQKSRFAQRLEEAQRMQAERYKKK